MSSGTFQQLLGIPAAAAAAAADDDDTVVAGVYSNDRFGGGMVAPRCCIRRLPKYHHARAPPPSLTAAPVSRRLSVPWSYAFSCILCLLSLMRFLNCVCAVDRQGLARLGVLIGYRLLKRHSRGYSAMVNALLEEAEEWTKRGKGLKTSQKNSAYETDFDVATIFAALELETRRIADAKAIAGAP